MTIRPAISPAIALTGLALLAAGCGSSSPAASSVHGTQNAVNAAYRYASCMREHGVSNFPDPQVHSGPGEQSITFHVGPGTNSPNFASAQKACQSILPGPKNLNPAQIAAQEQARRADLVAFARCLRERGLSNFPDPTPQGQLTLEMVRAAGIDLQAPGVLADGKACLGVTHGAVTLAAVERAVNGTQ